MPTPSPPPPVSNDPGLLPERIASFMRSRLHLGPFADIVAFELALLVFALLGWAMRARSDARSFTIHRESGWSGIELGLGLVVVVEALPIHLMLSAHRPVLAWMLTALSAYSLLWLIGDAQALRLRPLLIDDDALLVRVGLRSSARIPWYSIASVSLVTGEAPPRRARGYLRATAFGDPTVLIELNEAVAAVGIYGIRRNVTRVGVAPDDRARFVETVSERVRSAGGTTVRS